MFGTKLIAEPAVEPITLAEAKSHLRLSANTFSNDFTETISITPAQRTTGTVNGSSVDVLSAPAVVAVLQLGAMAVGSTVAAKIQESNDDATWTDADSGAFDAITTANANSALKVKYQGAAQYIRVVVTVTGDVVVGATIASDASASPDDLYVTDLIKRVRKLAESYTRSAFINQTWDVVYDEPPVGRFLGVLSGRAPAQPWLQLPVGPLYSISGIYYTEAGVTEAEWESTNYRVDTSTDRVILASSCEWPTDLEPAAAFRVRAVIGYGATAASVPQDIKQALLLATKFFYDNRDAKELPQAALDILKGYRVLQV